MDDVAFNPKVYIDDECITHNTIIALDGGNIRLKVPIMDALAYIFVLLNHISRGCYFSNFIKMVHAR